MDFNSNHSDDDAASLAAALDAPVMVDAPPAAAPSPPPPPCCWLCEYNQDQDAILMSRFIQENAPYMGLDQLTHMVCQRLSGPEFSGDGRSAEQIRAHIEGHVLIPSVQISVVLRSLIALLGKLEKALFTSTTTEGNEEEGIPPSTTVEIESKNVAIYLKVVNEILQIYKTGECGKLMFAEGAGGGGGAAKK